MSFLDLNLNKPLFNALTDLGFTTPTTIQKKVFSVVMSGRDVVGIAQTGTGKTFAYLLPTLRLWQFTKEKHPQVLILVPTRELVEQVLEQVKKLSTYTSVRAIGVYGETNIKTQISAIAEGVDVVVATPGRLFDLIAHGALKLKAIKRLIIDEMDEMLNLGFRPQITRIVEIMPEKRQNLLFSATITEDVEKFVNDFFNNPERVEAAPAGSPLTNINQTAYKVPNYFTKINLLDFLLRNEKEFNKVLIFTATKKLANELFDEIDERYEEEVGLIHSNKAQNQRFNSVNNFKSGKFRILIATDIIARGLDVEEVSHVINFDVPENPENYVHRIGRTGRADKKGDAIVLVSPKEEEKLLEIENLMKYKVPVSEFPKEVIVSTELTLDEMPIVVHKEIELKLPNKDLAGPAFHEKSELNKKVNVRMSRSDRMKLKYSKPKKRSPKK
ncbi:MAG: DEAD/DEAH box helicase [Bacteroidota bacterium]